MDTTIRPEDCEHDRLYKRALQLLDGQLQMHGVQLKPAGWLTRRRIRRAIQLLTRVMAINPANWAALWVIGKACQRLGEFAAALDAFARSHELNPDQPDVAREAGLTAMDLRRADLAIHYTSRAIAANPSDPGLLANLALCHLFNQSPQAALDVAQRALDGDPSDEITQRIVHLIREVLAGRRRCPTHRSEV